MRRRTALILAGLVVLALVALAATGLLPMGGPIGGEGCDPSGGTGAVSGTVYASDTQQVLEGATVSIYYLQDRGGYCLWKTTTTSSTGQWGWGGLVAGKYSVKVTAPTYLDQTQLAELAASHMTADLRFDLMKQALYQRCQSNQDRMLLVDWTAPAILLVLAALLILVGLWKRQRKVVLVLAVVVALLLAGVALYLVFVRPVPASEVTQFQGKGVRFSRALGVAVVSDGGLLSADWGGDFSGGYNPDAALHASSFTSAAGLLSYLQDRRADCSMTDTELEWFTLVLGG